MILNKTQISFEVYMENANKIAVEEYSYSVGHQFSEQEFLQYYQSGADVHEAIQTHQQFD